MLESLEKVGEYAFGQCRNLRKIKFPDNSTMSMLRLDLVSKSMSTSIIVPNHFIITNKSQNMNHIDIEFEVNSIDNGRRIEFII